METDTSKDSSSGGTTDASGESKNQSEDNNSTYPKDFVEKLKKEKANARAEAENLKKQLTEREAIDLEKAGKLNELVQLERARAVELENKTKNLSSMIIQKAVSTAVKSESEKMGAQYLEVIEKMIDNSKIEVNPETLEVDYNAIRSQIVGIKSKMPLLFKGESARTVDLPPSSGSNVPVKQLNELNNEELKELLRKKL